jgi:hypothetical protein
MDDATFQSFLSRIQKGEQPHFIGYGLTLEQVYAIKQAIDKHRQQWKLYFKASVETRLETRPRL